MIIKENFEFALKNHQKGNLKVAEKYYKKILKKDPNHFESIFLLGTLAAQEKNLEQAKQLLEKAVRIKPNFAEAQNNLGNIFVELKEFKKAESCYEKAIQIQPNHADAYFNYGNLLKSLEKNEEAINYYQKAIQINPNYLDVYNNLGVVLKELGEYQKAISCYKNTIKLKPNHVYAHYNLGLIFKDLNDFNNAKIYYEKAIQIQPNFVDALRALGNLSGNMGNFKKAIDCYKNAIKSEPENLDNYFSLMFFKKEILNTNLKNKVEKIIKNNNTNIRNMVFGNYLLAQYERSKKNYKKELNFLTKGHEYYQELKKKNFTKQKNHWFNVLPNINNLIKLDNKTAKNDQKIKPIFIVGVPRCGSTLTEKIIGSGSKNIPMGEETGVIDNFIKKQIQKNKLSNYNKYNFQEKILEVYKHKDLIDEKNNYMFTDKSLENFFYIGLIKEIFPSAKIINCKRLPLSSIMSIFQNNIDSLAWTHNLEDIFKYFDNYFKIIDYYKTIFPNFIYDLEYEKLIKEPEKESKKLLKFCNLPWDKKCLEFYKRKDLISKTASYIQIREAIYTRSLEKYLPYKEFLNIYEKEYSWFN